MRSIATVLVLGLLAAAPAHASFLEVTFTGTVTSNQGNSFTAGQTINGSFGYETSNGTIANFQVAGVSAQPPFNTIVQVAPAVLNPFSAIYEAQTSPVQQGGNQNQTFNLDLEALNTFPTMDPAAILTLPNLLSVLDLNSADIAYSNFGFYTATAAGTNVSAVSAALTGLAVGVPEPASLLLLAVPLVGSALLRRRA